MQKTQFENAKIQFSRYWLALLGAPQISYLWIFLGLERKKCVSNRTRACVSVWGEVDRGVFHVQFGFLGVELAAVRVALVPDSHHHLGGLVKGYGGVVSVEGEDGPLEVNDRQAVALRTSHESHLVLGLVFAVRTQSVGEVTVDLFGLESVRSGHLLCWLFHNQGSE